MHGGTILSAKQLLKNNGEKIIARAEAASFTSYIGATAQVSLDKSERSIRLNDFVIYMLASIEVSGQFYA